MRIFIIDEKNAVTVYATIGQARLGKSLQSFASERELGRLASDWSGSRLVEIWNKLPNTRAVQKFTDRNTAIQRIWKAVQQLEPSPLKGRGTPSSLSASADRAAAPLTKTECIITLLKRESGATLSELMEATGWQRHSMRGFICRIPQRFGFRIKSFKRAGEHVYRIR